MRIQRGHEAELVRRCLARDQDAWSQLFAEQQPRLLLALQCRLGPGHEEQADDAASLVWAWLLEYNFKRLRAYDPARSRLATFLQAIAGQVLYTIREEQARRPLDLVKPWAKELEARPAPPVLSGVVWEELAATLSGQERRYLDEHLSGDAKGLPPLSAVNQRVLRWRLRHKVESFLEDG